MKKIISVALVIVMLLLCACSAEESVTTASTSEETTLSPTVTVTFPEGYSAVQIAQSLEKNDVCSAADFMAQVNNPQAYAESYTFIGEIDSFDSKAFDLEGYIFPDTYEFYRGESATSAIERFLSNTQSKLTAEYHERAKELGYSMDEIITLASVIQKEAGEKEEMSKVSSVLHNRIESPDYGKLQCDVTINYVTDYVTDSVYLQGDTTDYSELYNTYKCEGVPAGAICNPGIEAIYAALYPEDTDYFYFVTDSDMNYYYAETYEEHLANCEICGINF